jgi:hypothetical protein
VHIHITQELAEGPRTDHHAGLYRALPRAELTAALKAGGFDRIDWLMPAATEYHQPIVLARRRTPRGRAARESSAMLIGS